MTVHWYDPRCSDGVVDISRPATSGHGGPQQGLSLAEVVDRAAALSNDQSVVARVLAALDAPGSDATRVAELVARDQVLAARLMRLANSARYGTRNRVTSLHLAISVVGFSAVRALAVASTVRWDRVPPEWTELTLLHAFSASMFAGRLGAAPADVLCAALLADLGRPLLLAATGGEYEALCARAEHPDDLPALERGAYGFTHEEVARDVFAGWNFPSELVDGAVHHHHDPGPAADPLTIAVRVGHEVAVRLQCGIARVDLDALTCGLVSDADVEAYGGAVVIQAADLRAAFV